MPLTAQDLHLILHMALEQIAGLLGISCGMVYRLTNPSEVVDEQCLSLVAWRGFSESFLRQFSLMPLRGSQAAPRHWGRSRCCGAWPITPTRLQQAYVAEGIHLGITVPLMVQGELVGALSLGVGEVRTFSATDLLFLTVIGQQLSTAIEVARLREAVDHIVVTTEASQLTLALRDSITQHLHDITLYAETIARLLDNQETAQAADYVQSMHASTLEALHGMQLLSSELQPLMLTKVGLAAALQARLNALTEWSGMTGDFTVSGDDRAALLPLSLQQKLYQIAQEVLQNTLTHAHARRIALALNFTPGWVVLDVRDDGIGFEPNAHFHADGYGLRAIREHVHQIGGTLHIEGTAGHGTHVCVSVPTPGQPF
ncbi:MAG: GAF domain-containing protein [Anaerolineae bacterium]|nr:MAG: GAF domain-containing protein [Anaerolineae bacterium]